MARLVFAVLEIALLVFCLIDAIQTPESSMRNLPKWAWIALIVIVPVVGPVAWLIAGRPSRARPGGFGPVSTGRPTGDRPRPGPRAPDDDPEFLARLKKENTERDNLRKWEADLKRREEELKGRPADEAPNSPDGDSPKS